MTFTLVGTSITYATPPAIAKRDIAGAAAAGADANGDVESRRIDEYGSRSSAAEEASTDVTSHPPATRITEIEGVLPGRSDARCAESLLVYRADAEANCESPHETVQRSIPFTSARNSDAAPCVPSLSRR